MTRGIRLKVLLGSCIIAMIGIFVDSNLLFVTAVILLLFSAVRLPHSPPTNYTEKFGPPDPADGASDIVTPFNETPVSSEGESDD